MNGETGERVEKYFFPPPTSIQKHAFDPIDEVYTRWEKEKGHLLIVDTPPHTHILYPTNDEEKKQQLATEKYPEKKTEWKTREKKKAPKMRKTAKTNY